MFGSFIVPRTVSVLILLIAGGAPGFAQHFAWRDGLPDMSQQRLTSPVVSLDSIGRITFQNNRSIAADRYDMEAAYYQFRHFERDLSQFTPFLADSRVDRRELRFDDPTGRPRRIAGHGYHNRMGVKKEFFNGSSVFGGIGHEGTFGDSPSESNPFVEGEARFPLFGSFTTLNRTTKRALEENEMFNARLQYIQTVRFIIREAQQIYLQLQSGLNRLALSARGIEDYRDILAKGNLGAESPVRQQIESEINQIQSELSEAQAEINVERVRLLDQIGIAELTLEEIVNVDYYSEDFYGSHYLGRDKELLIEEANANDAEIRVLENARDNSVQKLRLAEKGKWDMFGNVFGRYDFERNGDVSGPRGYEVGVGVTFRLTDPKLLQLSRQQAQAEINKYVARIERRQMELRNLIDLRLSSAKDQRGLTNEQIQTVRSRQGVFEQKREAFLRGEETVDNLIAARKKLSDAQFDLTFDLGDMYNRIAQLDELCGVYFEQLGLNMNEMQY